MKFIALVVSAAVCFSGISLVDGSIRVKKQPACQVQEELTGAGVALDANGNSAPSVSDVRGRINILNDKRRPCQGTSGGMTPITPAVAYAAKAAPAIPQESLALAANPQRASVSIAASSPTIMAAVYSAGGVTVNSPPGSLSAPDVKRVYNVAALGTGVSGSSNYHVALAAKLGQPLSANPIQASLKSGSGSFGSFSTLPLGGENLTLAALATEPLDAMDAAPLPQPSTGKVRMAIATSMAGGGVRVSRVAIDNSLAIEQQGEVIVNGARPVKKLVVSNTLDKSYFMDTAGKVYMVSYDTGTSKLLNPRTAAVQMEFSGDTAMAAAAMSATATAAAAISSVQMLTTVEQDPDTGRAVMVLSGFDPITGDQVAQHIEPLKASAAEVDSIAAFQDTLGSAFGQVMVLSRSDPRLCYWKNQKHARLYHRCMRKCCESAERGRVCCPRLCDLERSCSGDFHGYHPYEELPLPMDALDGAMIPEGYIGERDEYYHHSHGDCGCSSDTYDGCGCGDKRDLRECKCCCRRFLRREPCFKSMTEMFTFQVM